MKSSSEPVTKVKAAGVTGAIATLIVWFSIQIGIPISPDIAAAFATVGCFAAGYLAPPQRGE